MGRPAKVEDAFTVEKRYERGSLDIFKAYVDKQLQDGESDLEINLATLKLMLICPDLIDVSVIRKVLILSVSAYPANEFSLCMFQIPERLHKTDELRKVVELAHLLEMTKSNQFWQEAEKSSELDACKNWRGKIRNFITEVVMLTSQSIDLGDFAELTNLKGKEAEAKKLLQSKGLSISGDKVIIQQPEMAAEDSQPLQLTTEQLKKVLVSVR